MRVLAGRERAGRRRRVLAFAASCALFAALGAGAATLGGGEAAVHTRPGPSQSPDTGSRTGGGVAAAVAMKPVGSSELHAALSVTGKPWGTRLEWSCRYKGGHGKGHGEGSGDGHEDRGPAWDDGRAPKPAYELVVTDTSGKRSVVATWKGAGDAAEHLTASSKSTPQQIRSVGIRLSGSHRTLAEGTP